MVTEINKKRLAKKKLAPKTLTLSTLAGLLAACNSDSSSTTTVVTPVVATSLSGAVVKGPLQGALVYADADGDGIQGPNEVSATTLADGSYTISSSNAAAIIVATTTANTIDTSSGEVLSGITLKAPAGSSVVTPATTILESQPEIEPAQLAIALGIPTTAADGSTIDLMSFNPYAAGADPAAALAAEKASQQVMVTIKAVSAAAEGAGMSIDDAFDQAMASVAEVVSDVAATVDVSSVASIAAAESSMSTNKVDFSDSAVLDAVSTAVQSKVVAAAAADSAIVVDTTAFAAVLETAVTAVGNVNAAIEAITDTDLTSTESMGTFATLTDITSEIKAAAVAEVAAPGSGAALVTFTDATAVNAAASAASTVLVEAAAAEVAATEAAAAAAAAATAAEAATEAEAESSAEAAPAAAVAVFDSEQFFVVTALSGATYNAGVGAADQDLTISTGSNVLDISSDVQVSAVNFTNSFSNSGANVNETSIGTISIDNLRAPLSGSQNDQEVTVTITEASDTGDVIGSKIVAGFTVDWSLSGSDYILSSDDSSLDVVYTTKANSSTTINLANLGANPLTITPDNNYGGNSTINIDALNLITKLEATNHFTFSDLESRFAKAGTTLDVEIDVSNLNLYNEAMGAVISTITATIDIV
jgi:hypothetical protein